MSIRDYCLKIVLVGTAVLGVSLRSLAADLTAPPAMPVIDQETGTEQFLSFLRVEFFAPVGQSFVPIHSRHVAVNLFLRNPSLCACPNPVQPPAIFTVSLREGSLAGQLLASGTTPPFPFPALSVSDWVEIPLDEPVSLVPGDTYVLEVSTANVSGFWGRAGLSPYPDGVAFVQGVPTPHFDFGFQTLVLPTEEIEIDIKPHRDPNSVNLLSRGVIPVAILGSDTFDVTDVDVTTLAFGPDGAVPAHDLTKRRAFDDHPRDVNDDGFTDLISNFWTQDAGFAVGDEEACISGELLDGTPFGGCDSVQVVAPRNPQP